MICLIYTDNTNLDRTRTTSSPTTFKAGQLSAIAPLRPLWHRSPWDRSFPSLKRLVLTIPTRRCAFAMPSLKISIAWVSSGPSWIPFLGANRGCCLPRRRRLRWWCLRGGRLWLECNFVCFVEEFFVIFDWMLFNVALVTVYTRIIVVFVAPVNLLCRAGDAYLEFDGTSG